MHMGKRLTKQVIYGALFAAFWAIIFSGVYATFFRAKPSCTDGIRNQNEEGVDCGGVCGGFCLSDVAPINIESSIRAFSPSGSQVGFLAQISNPNKDFAATYFSYSWSILDKKGAEHRLPAASGFLYPGEIRSVGGVFDTPGFNPDLTTARLTIAADSVTWVRAAEFVQPRMVVQDSNGAPENGHLVVRGIIRNADVGPVGRVTVIVVLMDSRGQIVGMSPTTLSDLAAGQTAPFEVLYPELPDVDLARTQVFVSAYRR